MRSVPALPQVGLATLLPLPSMEENEDNVADNSVSVSRVSNSRRQRRRTGAERRPSRRGGVGWGVPRGPRGQSFMAVPPAVRRGGDTGHTLSEGGGPGRGARR